ncbi:hypothetical protein [Streptomyces violascens]|uniref:Uncharacterized protein n=1 Tax=Streptomyces violascens TaxID=67381 RepID=A0ABQ3QKS6_9ACTN|nr:hypothetical protein [Streptomyces violascens]GGT92646.1 hypothetical protein GCM10010289_10730 [Streptomyces violascens]GHI37878.1 hypothetical protein Sviol_22860 [Streptomyces violascens]
MTYYRYHGALIETVAISDGSSDLDGHVVEFWDTTPGGRGEMLHIYYSAGKYWKLDTLGQTLESEFTDWALAIAKDELLGP